MKFKYLLILSFLTGALLFISGNKIYAQSDTMTVEWKDAQGNLIVDALYNKVMGDTIAGGKRANVNRVYKLRRGGYYWNTSTITNKGWALRLIGEKPGTTLATAPAVIQMVLTSTGGTPGKMISVSGNLTLKNLYILGSDDQGVQTYYQPIEIGANDLRVIVDNCVFERSNFSMLAWQGGENNDVFITNCKFRNLMEKPPTQQWAGRGISMWKDQDTVIVENNTFFNVNMTPFQIENGAAKYLRFNHNTLVNIGRSIHSASGAWWREAYFSNLLLVNVFWHGEGNCDYSPTYQPGRDKRAYTTGMFSIQTLPSRYGTDVGRRIVFTKASAFLDSYFKLKYKDTVRVQNYTNSITDSFFTAFSPAKGGQMVISDTNWLANYPAFKNNPNNNTLIEAMYNHITASRAYQYYNSGVQAKPYFYELPKDPATGDTLWTSPSWPLPEDFTYTDASLLTASTDGLPLGDLNWFPTQKSQFESNKAQYVAQIEGLAGKRIVDKVAVEVQAESGTVADGAVVTPFTGTAWYTTAGGCEIKWTFDIPTASAGAVDMDITANLGNQNIGADLILNGTNLHDILGWGQFVFWGGPEQPTNKWSGKPNGWYTVKYTQADVKETLELKAGTNTLVLGYSWNPVSVKKFDFYKPGTTTLIASLTPAAATNKGGVPNGEGKWVPEGFNSVNLGTNGSVTFNVQIDQAGDYLARLFYQNPGIKQTGSVSLNGTQVSTLSYNNKTDSTGIDIVSDLFKISTTGSHAIKITGSGVKVDKVQLIQRTFTSVKDKNNIPEGYALDQNYPNPFNPTTKIGYMIPKEAKVTLKVYDILGREVFTLVNAYQAAGFYEVKFNASRLATGVYIYRIQAGDFVQTKKMMLLK